jgi:prepilin-type N-terminal cleavage/methylation domain-containing protein
VRVHGHDEEAVNDRGFTLIELLVACAAFLVATAFLASLAVPLRDGFERSLGASDLAGGTRMVLDRLAAEIREAGSRASAGGRLADVVMPVVPLDTVDAAVWADPGRAVRITRVPLGAAQGRLLAGAAAGAITVLLDTSARCTAIGDGCGLRPGVTALLYDATHAQSVAISAVSSGGLVQLSAPLTAPFAAGSTLVAASLATYGLRVSPGGAFRLVRATPASEQPLLDDVVGLSVSVRGADPFHPRLVDLALRVEAPSPSMRGPAGPLFLRAGTAVRPSSWVPDLEVRTTIAVRNGAA